MDSDLNISSKKLIKRLKELDRFKHSGSVREGEIEKLQEYIKTLETHVVNLKPHSNKSRKKLNRLVADIKSLKIEIKKRNEVLDNFEERFSKYNVPKRYENGHKQPLKGYVVRLQEYMEITWRKEAKKNREKGHWNLFEMMTSMDITTEDAYFAYDSLQASLEEIASMISSFLIEYLTLIMVASNESNEIVSRLLDELLTVVECLSIEQDNKYSLVNDVFVEIVRFFIGSMELAGPFWDDNEDDKKKKKKFYFDEEMEDDLAHHIIMEILRLEVSFSNPDFFPMMLINDMMFSISVHLKCYVFNEKLKRVVEKIGEWKSAIRFVEEVGDDDYSEMEFLMQVLEAGVHEICTDNNRTSWTLVNLVSK
ncbi:hypothetical protein CsatB_022311 [Cannabis sativa]